MQKKFLFSFLRSFLLGLVFISFFCSLSWASTFNVINNNSSGNGSLSWAVQSVNYIVGETHIIEIDSRIKNIAVPNELTITNSVVINGHGATLTGENGQNRLFTVTSGHVIFDSLTFKNGHAVSSNGGAINIEGANASAEFRNCTFIDNYADNYGGAICITNGSANPRTILTHCTLSGNYAGIGGGLAVLNGDAAMFSSIITGNFASYDIFRENSATLTGRYNITGSSNHDLGILNMDNIPVNEVFLLNDNGEVYSEKVNNIEVLKLSGNSLARDYIPVTESSYVLSSDETGTTRPQLWGYDSGAYEAIPVSISSAEIYGMPYIQVNSTESYSLDIYPSDATIGRITWSANPSSVLTVDDYGNVNAIGVGAGYISANIQGWDSLGNETNIRSNALMVYVGTEPRRDIEASITPLPDITMRQNETRIITPEVYITVNDIAVGRVKGWLKYELYSDSSRPDIAIAEVISDDSIRIRTGNIIGSADIGVIVSPLPSGTIGTEMFTVSVSEKDVGHSRGGGGCDVAGYGMISLVIIFAFRKARKD